MSNVFYVPQFKYNLLSASKLTKKLQCSATLFSDFCVFQDLFTGRVKEIGKEYDGLYLLLAQGIHNNKRLALAAKGFGTSADNQLVMDLWHRRFGHMSSVVLQRILPTSVQTIKERINKCIVSPCAKQTRLPFLSSCIQSSNYFDLIYIDP